MIEEKRQLFAVHCVAVIRIARLFLVLLAILQTIDVMLEENNVNCKLFVQLFIIYNIYIT